MKRAALTQYHLYTTGAKLPSLCTNEPWILAELSGYQAFLRDVAASQENSVIGCSVTVRQLLVYASQQGIRSAKDITVDCVRDYLTTETPHYKASSRKTAINRIRSYFRYLAFRGTPVDESVLRLPLSAPVWRLSSLPDSLSIEEYQALFRSMDRSTMEGIRDYAILLCMTELGLRCSEVTALTLRDFEWNQARLIIRKTKTHAERVLPIPRNLGESVVDYLRFARQASDEQKLFLSISRRAGTPLSNDQVRNIVSGAYQRAGITSVSGTHALRHTRARTLYENGVCLKLIADVLGHKSIDASAIYTKLGTSLLKSATSPWPEVRP